MSTSSDTIGRKKMIAGTYILSGILLAISAVLFKNGSLNATTQTICWAVVFFFASAGASAGYLTASEVFPLEVRAKAIAAFFAIAQCFGAFGSAWYAHLIGTGSDRNTLFVGYRQVAGDGRSALELNQRYVLTMPPRPAPRDLRASDADRERVIAMLGDALADGRISHEEYSERMPAALAARTLGDLAGLTTDLAPPERQPVQVDGGQPVTALFGNAQRSGRWVVPATLTCVATFGEVVLDLREALLQDRHVVVNVYALFGRVRLVVPAGVEVVMNGTEILGRQRGATARRVPTSSEFPVVEVRGYLAASEILARTPPRPRRWLRWGRASLP